MEDYKTLFTMNEVQKKIIQQLKEKNESLEAENYLLTQGNIRLREEIVKLETDNLVLQSVTNYCKVKPSIWSKIKTFLSL